MSDDVGPTLEDELERLENENQRLKELLRQIVAYPPEGHERRADEGYPAEIVYDEFAYRRIVDFYRESIQAVVDYAQQTD